MTQTEPLESPGTTGPGETVIQLDEVTKRYGDFVAVARAHFSIASGEFFSMLGPSGCGKTTTLRMIAGFEQPSSGHVLLEGKDVSKVPPYKRNVNTVFQQYALFPHLTVADNVAFGLRSKKVPEPEVKQRVLDMLDVVRLSEYAERRPAQLSGGQQQRVALARALVNLPSALLLDEPLGALDLKLRQVMQFELKRIQREVGITFIYVTHDQEEALTMSDRIAVMSQGHTAQIGTPEEIYHRPATAFVAGFIGTANLLPAKVKRVDGGTTTVEVAAVDHDVTVPTLGRGFGPGDSATLMLRPERLWATLEEPAHAPGGCMHVTVQDTVFQGPTTRCLVRTSDGLDLVAHLDADERLAGLRHGDPLWLSWTEEGAFLVADTISAAEAGMTHVGEDETR